MSRLINDMANDMKIFAYHNEKKECYYGRLVYSAFAHWIRYSTQDYLESGREYKSKVYLLNRGKEILMNLLSCIPEAKSWFLTEYSQIDEVVQDIRERMLVAGELIEVEDNTKVALPEYKIISCVPGIGRVLGLDVETNIEKFVGVTRLISDDTNGENTIPLIEIEQYMEWIFQNVNWIECSNLNDFEIFNTQSKRAPYQSWTNKKNKGERMFLGRLSLIKGLHEYWLIKNIGHTWYLAPLIDSLVEYKEERRILLGLRRKYGNPMSAMFERKENIVILKLFCRIPLREEGILETYCWPSRNLNDKLEYIVPNIIWDQISMMLSNNLGIRLKEKM